MSEMIERLARAIEAESNYVISQHHAKALARVAIEAMREPTEAMLSTSGYQDADEVWRDMIDAALAPPETDDNSQGGV